MEPQNTPSKEQSTNKQLGFLRELIKSVSRYRVGNKGLDIENLLKDIIAYEVVNEKILVIYTRYGLKIMVSPDDIEVRVV